MQSLRRPKRSLTQTRVLVAERALDAMLREAEARRPVETGGMLLGYLASGTDAETIVIESVIGPGPKAVHDKCRFEPDSTWQQRELAQAYASSGRITTYLGDWHTHPAGTPKPSRQDKRTARSIARAKSARAARPLMLILAPGKDGWRYVVYRFESGTLIEVAAQLHAAVHPGSHPLKPPS